MLIVFQVGNLFWIISRLVLMPILNKRIVLIVVVWLITVFMLVSILLLPPVMRKYSYLVSTFIELFIFLFL